VVVEHQSLDGLEDLVAGLLGLEGQLFGTEITGEFQVIGEMGDKLLVVELPVTGFYLPDLVDIQGFSPLSVREMDLPGCGIDLGTLADRQETEQPVKKNKDDHRKQGNSGRTGNIFGLHQPEDHPADYQGQQDLMQFQADEKLILDYYRLHLVSSKLVFI
jgi:hypothetical protein